jgi:hypothetical protein
MAPRPKHIRKPTNPTPSSSSQDASHKRFSIKSIHFPRAAPSSPSSPPPSPTITRTPSVQTRYISMLLALDTIPRLHNILVSGFT